MILAMTACESRTSASAPAVVSLEDIGIRAVFGEEGGDPLSVLARPVDATFANDSVYVLDASPPWVRVFARDVGYVRAVIPDGDGPNEARPPVHSLTATGSGDLLLGFRSHVAQHDRAGTGIWSTAGRPEVALRGVVEGCTNELYVLAQSETSDSTVVARISRTGSLEDSWALGYPIRHQGRRYHPWYVQAADDGLLLYTEEEDRNRVLRLSCDGTAHDAIDLDSLGSGLRVEIADGTMTVHQPEPPFPAGLAILRGHMLWARQAVVNTDTITIVTAYRPNEDPMWIGIRGWFQLLDANDETGEILANNLYGEREFWGLSPHVYLLDGEQLLKLLHRRPQ
jgi:hypothetical protein